MIFQSWAPQLKCQWEPGLLEIFPRAEPRSPVVIRSMIHCMLLLNVEVLFLRTLVEENANCSELPHTPDIYSGNIDVSFVLSSKGTLLCNSSSSDCVLVLNRTSLSLLHTFVAYTIHNFPFPFNMPVILSYTNTSRVNSFKRLLVQSQKEKKLTKTS